MPSKYSRKNRDRRGGHETSEVVFASGSHYNGKAQATPVTRATLKHLTKKVARRQAKKWVEQELAWEAWAVSQEAEEARIDDWLANMDLSDPYDDYFDYLQDQEDRLQDLHDDWFPDYDHNPYGSTHSRSEADRLTAKARQYSHLAATTVVTEADVGKTVSEVLEAAADELEQQAYRAYG